MLQNPTTLTQAELVSSRSPSEIRLLALDIDGTIAGHTNQITPIVLDAIHAVQAQGIAVAIATGRMYRSALRFYNAIGSTLPLISYQGALIKDPETSFIHQHWPVPVPLVHDLLDYFEHSSELQAALSVHLYIDDQLYVREVTPETEEYAERSEIQPIAVGNLRQVLTQAPTKVLALSDDVSLMQSLLNTLRQRYTAQELYLTQSVPTFFEAANPTVNKGMAVRYLAEELMGLRAENVMAIGDNWNDIEMITYAGWGVAMETAPKDVQAQAQWVAPSVDCQGVATAIQKFLL
jgi:Cof subfamily protein (haloacid dehalogenase superfamily)